MSETPDFDALARRIEHYFSPVAQGDALTPHDALRLIWNARGAADIEALSGIYGVQGATLGDVTRALKKRDR